MSFVKYYEFENDGCTWIYSVKKPWAVLFKLLGYTSSIRLQLNTVLDYKLKRVPFGSRLELTAHRHKINKSLNLEILPIWGLNKLDQNQLVGSLDKMIVLSKAGLNVGLIGVDAQQIEDFYSQKVRPASQETSVSLHQNASPNRKISLNTPQSSFN
ncbi:hypothetical protein [Roseivirga sp. E12]|uniref:hypothetical protein n=1 Tax=Roseivirga sp. E12 TaxID=2819237 RepID=UPI001ABBFE7D|nr:hypothetical protein [Roseivirga sp. E12]MBO3699993.1 hypothetical protein [Roseivirga sp. E12]